jgi:hypothetical protein
MSRFSDIQEVLRVTAPVLVLLAILTDTLTTGSLLTPLALKLLLKGVGKLYDINLF